MEVADALAPSESRGRVREFILHLRGTAACEIVPASRELLDRALDDKRWTLTLRLLRYHARAQPNGGANGR